MKIQAVRDAEGPGVTSAGKRRRRWRMVAGVCWLVYCGMLVYLGLNDFSRVHQEYRRTGEALESGRVREATLAELLAECRRELAVGGGRAAARTGRLREAAGGESGQAGQEGIPCASPPPAAVMAAREKTVTERLGGEHTRAGRKLILFYASFGVFFLVVPPALLLGFVFFVVRLYGMIRRPG